MKRGVEGGWRVKVDNALSARRKARPGEDDGLNGEGYSDVRFFGNESELTWRTFAEYSSSSRY